jgi:hypothetical protein
MTGAAMPFARLLPNDMPMQNVALDIWIIRHQNVILTQRFRHDSAFSLQFTNFTQMIQSRFGQAITIESQNYNQVLVLIEQRLQFVNIDSQTMFLCQNTTNLAHVATLFHQIIEQDKSFLLELTFFQNMLQNAEILTENSIVSDRTLAKRHVSANNTVKRSLGDIFTPYSVTSIGDTANNNYRLVNRNFNSIQVTETKLAHAQNVLSQNIMDLQDHEIELLMKEIFLELRSLQESALNSFFFDLQQIITHNHLDKSYDIVFALLRNTQLSSELMLLSPNFQLN